MFCPRQGPGGGGHKGRLSGLGASRSCSGSLAPFLLPSYSFPSLPALAGTGRRSLLLHTHNNRQQKQTNTGYGAPLALPRTSHGATPLFSPGGDTGEWFGVPVTATGCTHWSHCSPGPSSATKGAQPLTESQARGQSRAGDIKTTKDLSCLWGVLKESPIPIGKAERCNSQTDSPSSFIQSWKTTCPGNIKGAPVLPSPQAGTAPLSCASPEPKPATALPVPGSVQNISSKQMTEGACPTLEISTLQKIIYMYFYHLHEEVLRLGKARVTGVPNPACPKYALILLSRAACTCSTSALSSPQSHMFTVILFIYNLVYYSV